MPRRGQRAGLGLAVADHAGDDQVGIIERRAIGMDQRIAELAALADRARRLRRGVAGNATGKRELPAQLLDARGVAADVGIDLAVAALEIGVRHHTRPAMPGSAHIKDAEIVGPNRAVQMRVDEIKSGRGAPVAEQPRLDMVACQRLAQQGVVEQIDLSDRQIIGGAPVAIDQVEFRIAQGGKGGEASSMGAFHVGQTRAPLLYDTP